MLQFENWNRNENCHARNTFLAMPQSRNYNHVPVQSDRLSVIDNIDDRF